MRIYVPSTLAGLADLRRTGSLGPAVAHAVTPALQRSWAGADEEELEYAVLMAAAFDSLVLVAEASDRPRRVVIVADVDDAAVAPAGQDAEETAVSVVVDIPLARCVAVHVDGEGAESDVARAIARVPAALTGDERALADVSLVEHELLWYATQEIPDLVG